MVIRLHESRKVSAGTAVTANLTIETRGRGLTEITREVKQFLHETAAADGVLLVYLRHTSASLVIQENADPDVGTDLLAALDRLAPENAGWIHDSEGSDDMPAHVKAMLTGVSLHVPVIAGSLALGVWQGIFLAEHRRVPHTREVVLQFLGSSRQ